MNYKNISKKFDINLIGIKFKFFFSLILSIIIISLSQNDYLWIKFWSFLSVPPVIPAFSDFKALNIFLSYKQQGFNPYFENPNSHSIHNVFMYPSIWLYITDLLHLQNQKIFTFWSFLIIFMYFWVIIDLFEKFKNTKFKYFLILFFFSTSNFLIIERLNAEIIIFCLIYFSVISKNFFLKNLFFVISFVLKIFPIFSIFLFINKKKNFFVILLFSLTYFFIFREEIALMSKNFIEWALIFSYGVVSIAKGFYYYSVEYGYFINEGNYKLFKYFLIFLTSFYGLLLFLLKFKFEKNLSKNISLEEKMFLAGGGIFIGTFIVSANVDYRLVFLLLTLPYLSQQLSQKLNIIYFIVLLICFNSLLFSAGNPYGYIFFLKALCVYALKIIIFSLNCYYFGYILNKFIKIKIFNFKIT